MDDREKELLRQIGTGKRRSGPGWWRLWLALGIVALGVAAALYHGLAAGPQASLGRKVAGWFGSETDQPPTSVYRWRDATGHIHYTSNLDRVPEESRAKAERVAWRDGANLPGKVSLVTLYREPDNPDCDRAAEWLTGRGVAFRTRDIGDAEAYNELVALAGYDARLPVMVVNTRLVRGFDPDQLGELLPAPAERTVE